MIYRKLFYVSSFEWSERTFMGSVSLSSGARHSLKRIHHMYIVWKKIKLQPVLFYFCKGKSNFLRYDAFTRVGVLVFILYIFKLTPVFILFYHCDYCLEVPRMNYFHYLQRLRLIKSKYPCVCVLVYNTYINGRMISVEQYSIRVPIMFYIQYSYYIAF